MTACTPLARFCFAAFILLLLSLPGCGGKGSGPASFLAPYQPTTDDDVFFSPYAPEGLPTVDQLDKAVADASAVRSWYGAVYSAEFSSPAPVVTEGEGLTAVISPGSSDIGFAVYSVGSLSVDDHPQWLTVVVEPEPDDDRSIWLGVSDYSIRTWRWFEQTPTGGVVQVYFDELQGSLVSPMGSAHFVLAAEGGTQVVVKSCHMATSAEGYLALDQAQSSLFHPTYADFNVWTTGPPAGVSVSETGVLGPIEIFEGVTAYGVGYVVTLPVDGSVVAVDVEATPPTPNDGAGLLEVLNLETQELRLLTYCETAGGSFFTWDIGTGIYELIWLEFKDASATREASIALVNDFLFPRDSWPIGNSDNVCWGMSLGASYFAHEGRFNPVLGSEGLYTHFGGDDAWAKSAARRLQSDMSISLQGFINRAQNLWPAGSDGQTIAQHLESARLMNGGYPVVSRAGENGAHAVVYVGCDDYYTYFYNPNHPYHPQQNVGLDLVPILMLPDWGLGILRPPYSEYVITGTLSDARFEYVFDPLNRDDVVGYEYPLLSVAPDDEAGLMTPIVFDSPDSTVYVKTDGGFWYRPENAKYDWLMLCWKLFDPYAECDADYQHGVNWIRVDEVRNGSLLRLDELLGSWIQPGALKTGSKLELIVLASTEGSYGADEVSGEVAPPGLSFVYSPHGYRAVNAPSQVQASDGDVDNGVSITWLPPATGATPTGYNVYRAGALEGPWAGPLNAAPVSTSPYMDNTGEPYVAYWYAVTSLHSPSSQESPRSLPDQGHYQPSALQPGIAVSPLSIVRALECGQEDGVTIFVENTGDANLVWSTWRDRTWIALGSAGDTTPPSETDSFAVAITAPDTAGDYDGLVRIDHNVPGEAPIEIPIDLTATDQPTYTLSGLVSKVDGGWISGVEMTLTGHGSTFTVPGGYYEFTGVSDGSYTLSASYDDWDFGNSPRTVQVSGGDETEDFSGEHAPLVSISTDPAPPVQGPAPLDVDFDASTSSDPDGGSIEQYDWDLDGDGSYELIDVSSAQSHTYDIDDVYTVRCRVTDDEGATGIGSVTVTVTEHIPAWEYLTLPLSSQDGPNFSIVANGSYPYVATRSGNTLWLMKYDGSDWSSEQVDSDTGTGGEASIGIGPGNIIYIAHGVLISEANPNRVRVSKYTSSWSHEDLVQKAEPGFGAIDLAVESGGDVAVSYAEHFASSPEKLWLQWHGGSSWSDHMLEESAGNQVFHTTDVCFDSGGDVVVAYIRDTSLKTAWYNGSSWDYSTHDTAFPGGAPDLAVNPAGVVQISYWRISDGNLALRYYDGGSWNSTTPYSGSYTPKDGTSLAFDSSGNTVIAFGGVDGSNNRLIARQKAGSGWSSWNTILESSNPTGYGQDIAYNDLGEPMIVFLPHGGGNLKLAWYR